MPEFETLLYRVEDGVATVTLNRPELRNSLNRALRLELRQAVEEVDADRDVRAVILSGAGGGFCAGADLTERLPGADREGFVTEILHAEYHPVILGIRQSPKPWISAINGAAAGIGSSLALACDMVVMADDACLYSAFASIGLIPDGGSHRMLQEQLGSKRSFEMIALSQKLEALRCLEHGLANRVVPADSLLPEAEKLARQLTQAAPLTLRYSKQILWESARAGFELSMALEAEIQELLYRSRDFKEGVTAFFEKRKAEFEGC